MSRRVSERKEKKRNPKKNNDNSNPHAFGLGDVVPIINAINNGGNYPASIDATTNVRKKLTTKRIENFDDLVGKLTVSKSGEIVSHATTTTTEDDDIIDYSPKEKLADELNDNKPSYHSYKNGLLCENKQPFTGLQFCFACEKEDVKLLPTKKVTSRKLDGDGNMIQVYRQLFLCHSCIEDSKGKGLVKISPRTYATYYQ